MNWSKSLWPETE